MIEGMDENTATCLVAVVGTPDTLPYTAYQQPLDLQLDKFITFY